MSSQKWPRTDAELRLSAAEYALLQTLVQERIKLARETLTDQGADDPARQWRERLAIKLAALRRLAEDQERAEAEQRVEGGG